MIIGYDNIIKSIIHELEGYLSQGSKLILYLPMGIKPDEELEKTIRESHLGIETMNGHIPDSNVYEKLVNEGFTKIIVLSSRQEDCPEIDRDVLLSLIYLRKISNTQKIRLSIIGKINDIKNSEIAKSTNYRDFIVSSNICGRVSTQLSENRYLKPVLDDIFDEAGSEIYTKPVKDYVTCGEEINYATLVRSAMLKGEICIGYMVCKGETYEYVMNPRKTQTVRFNEEDTILVVAED